jgi:hypothetical protein
MTAMRLAVRLRGSIVCYRCSQRFQVESPTAVKWSRIIRLSEELSEVPGSSRIRGVRWWSDERVLIPLCLIPNPAPPYYTLIS